MTRWKKVIRSYTFWNLILVGGALGHPIVFLSWARWSSLFVMMVVMDGVMVERFEIREYYDSILPGPVAHLWVVMDVLCHYAPIMMIGFPARFDRGFLCFLFGFSLWSSMAIQHLPDIYSPKFHHYSHVIARSLLCTTMYGIGLAYYKRRITAY